MDYSFQKKSWLQRRMALSPSFLSKHNSFIPSVLVQVIIKKHKPDNVVTRLVFLKFRNYYHS
ncbi:MAG: hypothetical protein ABI237_09300 [Ginsengibacter sp.]